MRVCSFIFLVLLMDCLQAQDPGFFLDNWKEKSFITPAHRDHAKPTSLPATTIRIFPDDIINKVAPSVFGNNVNPYMTQMVNQPKLIEYIKDLSPNILRFPGGNLSSIYFWDALPDKPPETVPDSLYDSDGNKVKAWYWYGKNNDDWTISLDNYYSMLELTGSKGIITVNYSFARYSTSEDPVAEAAHYAAEWVRYDNGRTKYWEIGNENAGPWQAGFKIDTFTNKDGQPEIITGHLYGRHYKIFADSMHAAAEEIGHDIKIGAQLIQYEASSSWNPVDRTWNQGFFETAANAADFFIIHSYYTNFAENSSPQTILNSATTETRAMTAYIKSATEAANIEMKPLALTEWNIFAEGSRQMVSSINGLHAAIVLGELIEQKYGLATRWVLANGWNNGNDHGMFNNRDEPGVPDWNPRPAFFYMYYFQRYVGDRAVRSEVYGNSDLLSYASTYSTGETAVVLINKSGTATIAKLEFSGFIPGNRYYWYTLETGNDNPPFSGKVLVNSTGSALPGGPQNYETIEARSALSENDLRITIPPGSMVMVMVEKGSVTSVADIDPEDKLLTIYPNPVSGTSFSLRMEGIQPGELTRILIRDALGKEVLHIDGNALFQKQFAFDKPAGIYFVEVYTKKGLTIKKLVKR